MAVMAVQTLWRNKRPVGLARRVRQVGLKFAIFTKGLLHKGSLADKGKVLESHRFNLA
jgi:hypothetical protein